MSTLGTVERPLLPSMQNIVLLGMIASYWHDFDDGHSLHV
jgi:hypothetical protein